jgi:hypothetical protein
MAGKAREIFQIRRQSGKICQNGLHGHKVAIIHHLRSRGVIRSTLARSGGLTVTVSLADQGIEFMRKIVLAAAVAGSALGLAACTPAEEATEAAEETMADTESVAEEAMAEGEEAAAEGEEAAAEGEEAAEEATEEAAE